MKNHLEILIPATKPKVAFYKKLRKKNKDAEPLIFKKKYIKSTNKIYFLKFRKIR